MLGRSIRAALSSAVLITLVLSCSSHAIAQGRANIVGLGTLGGSASFGLGIKASGQVAGYSLLAGDSVQHAFLYSGGMQDLGTLGGTLSQGSGINDSGQVVGTSTHAGDTPARAFLYSAGSMRDLGTLGGNTNSIGNGINVNGDVTGYGALPGDTTAHAFLYTGGRHAGFRNLGWQLQPG